MNKAILIGNVGRDPNVKYFEGGRAVAQVTLATTERGYTLQNGTQVPDRTEWHNLVFRNGLAQTVEKYVHKGDKLYVEGKIFTRNYDDQSGIKRYVTEIYVDESHPTNRHQRHLSLLLNLQLRQLSQQKNQQTHCRFNNMFN